MNKKLIALAQAEGCAIINDGTVEELNKVLKVLPSYLIRSGAFKYYWLVNKNVVGFDLAPSHIPCHSVREFLQDEEEQDHGFKWGEEVMWEFRKATYVATSPTNPNYSVIICGCAGWVVPTTGLSRITPKRRITRAEIKEKLGIEGEWEIVD